MKAKILYTINSLTERHVMTMIAAACILSALSLTIVRVETGFSKAETLLCIVIPVTALAGGSMSILMKHHFRLTAIDCIALVWYLYAMGWFWIDGTYPASGFAVKSTLVILLYVSMRMLTASGRRIGEIMVISLILFSLIEALIGYSQLLSGSSRHHLYPVTGSFLNPGPYSAYLAMGIVLLLQVRKTNLKELITDILLMIIAVPLALTMSRAAFLAVAVCVMIMYRKRIGGWKQWSIVVAIAVAIGVALYIFKSGSADGRGIINYIGARCISDNPWFGNGIGSFYHSYAEETALICQNEMTESLMKVDVIDYAFNDLLFVGVEQGLVGFSLAIALICIVLCRLWKGHRPLFYASLSLLIISLFSYPFELLPYQIVGVIVTAYAGGITRRPISAAPCENKKDKNYGWRSFLKIIIIVFIVSMTSLVLFDTVQEKRKAEREYSIISGIPDSAFIKDYYELLPQLQGNKRFLFNFGVMLAKAERYNDSNDMLRRGALISNDPMFLVLQGNNYRDMEAFDEAEAMYLKAWHTMPNRIYPLYQIMKLYQKENDTKMATEYAEKVISFKEKIPSPAVSDMKREAHAIINQNINLK